MHNYGEKAALYGGKPAGSGAQGGDFVAREVAIVFRQFVGEA